jgi:cell wall-associated NlpC family hydrolase
LKNVLYLAGMLVFLASCASMKKSTATAPATQTANKSPRFLEGISISQNRSGTSVKTDPVKIKPASTGMMNVVNIENLDETKFKYSIWMNLPVESPVNEKLFGFIDEWYGTPYRYGGSSRDGVDCSAFTSFLMSAVYGLSIPRTSGDQFSVCKKINKGELEEGDLVFFKTRSRITHVGVYVGNNKFAHASTSAGVIISDLDELYFSRRYAGSGRVRSD